MRRGRYISRSDLDRLLREAGLPSAFVQRARLARLVEDGGTPFVSACRTVIQDMRQDGGSQMADRLEISLTGMDGNALAQAFVRVTRLSRHPVSLDDFIDTSASLHGPDHSDARRKFAEGVIQ